MRCGWVLVTLYTGPFDIFVYWCVQRARRAVEQSEPSLWEQSVESTIHCVAGDASGILLVAVVANWLRLPMGVELIAAYVAGFAVGLLLVQAPSMKSTFGSYRGAVRGPLLPETLSMNAIMAGMIPVMIILTSRSMSAMKPTAVRFWGAMALAVVVSAGTTFPVNWWLVTRGLKHGTGGEERGRLRHAVSATNKLTAALLTLAMLAGGIILADRYGDFSLSAGDTVDMPLKSSRGSMEST